MVNISQISSLYNSNTESDILGQTYITIPFEHTEKDEGKVE